MKAAAAKPYVICHMLGSLDGRIRTKNWGFKDSAKYFEEPAARIKADAWLVGRVTMQEFCSKTSRPRRGRYTVPKGDYVAPVKAKMWCVAIDPSGKCRWDTNMVSTEHVIEVLTEKVSAEYLDHLREKKVSYIFAGKTKIDLKLALKKLYTLFGIKTLRIDGGGHVNGAFMKDGLIDEFSLVLAPVVENVTGSLGVFEAAGARKATQFHLSSVKRIYGDFLWLRYKTKRKAA